MSGAHCRSSKVLVSMRLRVTILTPDLCLYFDGVIISGTGGGLKER